MIKEKKRNRNKKEKEYESSLFNIIFILTAKAWKFISKRKFRFTIYGKIVIYSTFIFNLPS